jgi:hypothetical protein
MFKTIEKNSYENIEDIFSRNYRTRRALTINKIYHKQKFNKVLIPYDFDKNTYDIKLTDINFYEDRDYVIQKLHCFSQNPLFNIENKYKMNKCNLIILYLFIVILIIFLVYIFSIIAFVIFFNPAIILFSGYFIDYVYKSFKLFLFIIHEKLKINNIKKILENENKTNVCISKKLKWCLGQSGYWIEIVKLV